VALFLMDYPNQTRLKVIGRARIVEPGEDPALEARLRPGGNGPGANGPRVERIFVLTVVGFDWNCSQHITPRYSREELAEQFPDLSQEN
jgi:hypothetical protein